MSGYRPNDAKVRAFIQCFLCGKATWHTYVSWRHIDVPWQEILGRWNAAKEPTDAL